LLATLFILIRSPIPPTTIFTIEAPPQRFSQTTIVSLPDEIYSSSQSRPYYLGHHQNTIGPMNGPHLLMAPGGTKAISNSTSSARQTIMMVPPTAEGPGEYYYQPNMQALSSPSLNNTTTEEGSSSSYNSSRLPHIESQISTLDSIFTGYPPIQLDLPIIQLGTISQMDISFLEKIQI
jgi:hypothetical protein